MEWIVSAGESPVIMCMSGSSGMPDDQCTTQNLSCRIMRSNRARRVRHYLSAILVLHLALGDTAWAIELPPEDEKWLELRIEGFRIFTNAQEKKARDVARDLQNMRSAISKVTSLNVRTPVSTKVFVFRNTSSFAPYRDAAFPRTGKDAAGVFVAHGDGNYIIVDGSSRSGSGVVYHELTHYFLNNTATGTPLWLSEGLAEFYSTFTMLGDDVVIGKPIVAHLRRLRQERPIPLSELFSIVQSSKEYNEGSRAGAYYAQAWALVHYLLLGNSARKDQLASYGRLLTEGQPMVAAFDQAFGVSYKQMELEVKRYIRARRFPFMSFELGALASPSVPEPVPMKRDDLLFALGDLLAHSSRNNFRDASTFLAAALAVNSKHSGANSTMGFISEIEGNTSEAVRYHEIAVASDSSEADVYMLAGENLMRRAAEPSASSRSLIEQARKLFQKAAQLNPEMSRIWAGLGSTYLHDGNPAEGITALEKSWSLTPSRLEVAHNMVVIYGRMGERDKAAEWIEKVRASGGDSATVASAREALNISDLRRAEDLLKDGKAAQAEKVLHDVMAHTALPDLKRAVAGLLSSMKSVADYHHDIDRYNTAVRFANQQNFDDALPILDEVIATSSDESLVASAKEMRANIQAFRKR